MTYTSEEANILLNQEYAKKEQEIMEKSFMVNEDEDEWGFLDMDV